VNCQQSSTVAKAREIIQKDGFGLRGLNKGVTATMARNGMFNMIYFSFYHNMKQFIPKHVVRIAYSTTPNVCRYTTLWNMNDRNVGFSVIHVSQGSVATYVRCGGMNTQSV